jgi:cobalamin biosynthesis Mg chelatase CobN
VKIKMSLSTGLRLAFASMLVAGALVLPSAAAAHGQCSQANSDPTAAQYCSPAGVQGEGGKHHNQGVEGASESGSNGGPTSGDAAPVVEEAPAVEAVAVQESSTGSTLPFTGLDVGILVIVALALGGTGLVLRQLTATRETKS